MEQPAYEGTDGDLTLEPSLDAVRAFLALGPDYWLGGSGSAYIGTVRLLDPGYSTLFDRPVLHLIVHPPYGVCLMFQEGNRAFISFDPAAPSDQLVVHYLGGEPACLPRAVFLSMSAAEIAIREFLESRRMSESVEWRARVETTYGGYTFARTG